jgi:hypothetical protein
MDPRTTEQVLPELLGLVRRKFYADAPARSWFIAEPRLKKVLCYPALRLADLGVELSPDDYVHLVNEQLVEICRSGQITEIRYTFPEWLATWLHNWIKSERTRIYNRQKLKAALGRVSVAAAEDAVQPLAGLYRLFLSQRRATKGRRRAQSAQQEALCL